MVIKNTISSSYKIWDTTCVNFRANALVVSEDLKITDDGVNDTIFNGIPDFAYEMLLLYKNYAHYINPSGSLIAFAQFNDTMVPIVQYPMYGHPEQSNSGKYPFFKWV